METEYDASQALSAYGQSEDSTVGFASVLGTPIVGALLPELDRDGLTASGDAEWALMIRCCRLILAFGVGHAPEQVGPGRQVAGDCEPLDGVGGGLRTAFRAWSRTVPVHRPLCAWVRG